MAENYSLSVSEFKRRVLEGVARAVREGVGVYYSTTEDEFAAREYAGDSSLCIKNDPAKQRHLQATALRRQLLTKGYVDFMTSGLHKLSKDLLRLREENIESPQIRAKARQLDALTIRIRKVFGEVQEEHGEKNNYLISLGFTNQEKNNKSSRVTRQIMEEPVTELVINLLGSTSDVIGFVQRVISVLPDGALTEEILFTALDSVTTDHDPPEVVDEIRCALQVVYEGFTQAPESDSFKSP